MSDHPIPHPRPVTPRLRGRLHQLAFLASIPAGVALLVAAGSTRARLAALIYVVSLVGMFGTSTALHRGRWSARAWLRMDRLDRAMIYVLIAGSYTPVILLAVRPGWREAFLALVWTAAAAGIVLVLLRTAHPGVGLTRMLLYLGLGWASVLLLPQLVGTLGLGKVVLAMVGGLFYTAGVVVLIRQRPDPSPQVFGYHEVWHAFTVAAGVCHFTFIWLLATAG
ncbi:MAG TPA: hemolysin III family protein [Actinomycetota bacterium]|jgi:hemolysin III|nr:hemolysin III family protein [Actinomycetota bacterium]